MSQERKDKSIAHADNANKVALMAMKENASDCRLFGAIYGGLKIRAAVPQPEAQAHALIETMTNLWNIHVKHCSSGGDITTH